jgi:hypothetical protein
VWRAFYNDQRFLPSLIQQELVDAGFYGRKSGRGFYDYREGAEPAPQTEAPQTPAGKITCSARRVAEALAERLQHSGLSSGAPRMPTAASPKSASPCSTSPMAAAPPSAPPKPASPTPC